METASTALSPIIFMLFTTKKTREVYKYVISGGRIRKDPKSSRAESQVRVLGGDYESKIIAKGVTHSKALDIEQGKVNAYSVSAQRSGTTGVRTDGKALDVTRPTAPEGNINPSAKL